MTEQNKKQYKTVKQIAESYDGFTESAIRFILFNRKQNKFDSCVRKIGRKILISENDFLQWIENHK